MVGVFVGAGVGVSVMVGVGGIVVRVGVGVAVGAAVCGGHQGWQGDLEMTGSFHPAECHHGTHGNQSGCGPDGVAQVDHGAQAGKSQNDYTDQGRGGQVNPKNQQTIRP